jgi:hypothetical protein
LFKEISMATVITANSIGIGDRITPSDNDIVIVNDGVVVASTDADGIDAFANGNIQVIVNGTVSGENEGVELRDFSSVAVGPTGTIVGGFNAVFFESDDNVLDNRGIISGDSTAVRLAQSVDDTAITNAGSILSMSIGIQIDNSGSGTTITNTGSITAVNCSIPDDHISPRRSSLFMARSVLNEVRDGRSAC